MDYKIVSNNNHKGSVSSYNKFKKEDIPIKSFEPFNNTNRL